MENLPDRAVRRLARYRALLLEAPPEGRTHIFSHELSIPMCLGDSQVRRDLMAIGTRGDARHGYDREELLRDLEEALGQDRVHGVAVVGVGKLGRGLIESLEAQRGNLRIKAAFDVDPAKCHRVFSGVKCYPMELLDEVIRGEQLTLGVLCVPRDVAQPVAERLALAGLKGLVNFAPVALRLPRTIALEEIDITNSLEKVAYFSLHPSKERRNGRREER